MAGGSGDQEPSGADGSDDASARTVQGAQYGNYNIQVNHYVLAAPERTVSWPVRVGLMPALADCFQTRAEADSLELASGAGSTVVLTQVLAGLGGVGKSQIAAAHARKRAQDVDLLVWVDAKNRTNIVDGYRQAARSLGYEQLGGADQAARWFMAWLQNSTGRTWLVVLDDLSDPTDLRGLWPDGPNGGVLVTTRRQDSVLAARGRRRIDVGLYSEAQALDYLGRKLAATPGTTVLHEADLLAADLGYLPLALAQAAAFIADRGGTCAEYRRRFGDQRRRLTELFPVDALADDYRQTVATTWAISMDAADRLAPSGVSRPLLEVASLLDPQGFPSTLARTAAITNFAARHRVAGTAASETAPTGSPDGRDALYNLARFSLVSVQDGGALSQVRVHALVQRAVSDRIPPSRRTELVQAIADGLLDIWPDVERNAVVGQVLRANAATFITGNEAELWQTDAHAILWRLGRSLGECGLVSDAVDYWTALAERSRRERGDVDPRTTEARRSLAYWWGQAGSPHEARSTIAELLHDQVSAVGPDDGDVLVTRASLARWRGQEGDAAGAVADFRELVAIQTRVLGPDDVATLTTRHDLAYWQGQANDPAGAVAALAELLDDQVRVLGAAHPRTLITRGNLSMYRGLAGDAQGAVEAYTVLLADRIEIQGPSSPSTLRTRASLASWTGQAGQAHEAARSFAELLVDQLAVLGPDHPDTLKTRGNLARWRGETGDRVGALEEFEKLLHDRIRLLGPDHPSTLKTRGNIARLRGELGDAAGALAHLQEVYADQLSTLGSQHVDTQITRRNIDRFLQPGAGPD